MQLHDPDRPCYLLSNVRGHPQIWSVQLVQYPQMTCRQLSGFALRRVRVLPSVIEWA